MDNLALLCDRRIERMLKEPGGPSLLGPSLTAPNPSTRPSSANPEPWLDSEPNLADSATDGAHEAAERNAFGAAAGHPAEPVPPSGAGAEEPLLPVSIQASVEAVKCPAALFTAKLDSFKWLGELAACSGVLNAEDSDAALWTCRQDSPQVLSAPSPAAGNWDF